MDNFYKGLTPEEHEDAENYNFDHPDALDFDQIYEVVKKLMRHEDADIPNYDFATHTRTKEVTHIVKSYFILFEGILALHDERINKMMDLKLFVHEDDDVRLARRIRRDMRERGRDVIGVLKQWHNTVKPSFDEFVAPTMKFADLIVQGNEHNKTAIQFIVENLTIKMINMGVAKRQIEDEKVQQESRIRHHVNNEMDKGMFDSLVKKLVDEKGFEEMHLVFFMKKLKEFYGNRAGIKITLLQNLNKRTSLKKGNLQKGLSYGDIDDILNPFKITVFYPSLLKEEEISLALDKINLIGKPHISKLSISQKSEFPFKYAKNCAVKV